MAGMKILEYDNVDPLGVLHLSLLALDFALTPEHAAYLRRTDPRPFPCLAVYAVEDEIILGQVGVFRLPMVSSVGREDVGGIWAVSTHPEFSRRGVASRLLDEAHARMRSAGLRFSTLGTNRYRVAYRLYQQHGYEDTQVLTTALAPWATAHQPTRLHARPPGPAAYDFVESLFAQLAPEYIGFTWRHTPFAPLRDKVSPEHIWILWENNQPVGYAIARIEKAILKITNVLLHPDLDIAEAIAALVAKIKTNYVQVKLSRPSEILSLQHAGYQVARPTWGAFMVKPLTPDVTVEDARQLFGVGTDRFLISWLDLT